MLIVLIVVSIVR